jgi:hypothetical protein
MNYREGYPNDTALITFDQDAKGFSVSSFCLPNEFGFVGC